MAAGPASPASSALSSRSAGDGRARTRIAMNGASSWLLSAAVVVSSLALARPVQAGQEPPSQKRVLALHGTGRDVEGTVTIDRELRRNLSRGLDGALDYYSEYFDSGRFPELQYEAAFAEFLRQKYGGRHFDVLVTLDNGGLEFLAEHRDELFPGVPVVFWSFVGPSPVTLPNSTGILAQVDLGGSLELATALQPDVEQVFVVSGAAPSDRVSAERALDQFRRFEPRLRFTFLSGLPTSELRRRLAALPPASIVYYLVVYQDGDGQTFQPLEYLDEVTAVANRPTYAWIDSGIGHGVVGGRMLRLAANAAAIARLALRVLEGERAESIPVAKAAVDRDVVDWRQLRRFGISEARVPAGAEVLFREPGVWEQYRAYIVGAVAFMLVQSALIGGLLIQRRARQRAEVESRRNLALAADANRRVTMTALTGSIAHELGQPLNAILHNATAGEMLVAGSRATPETLREILADIRAGGLRASQIVERHRTMLRSRQLEAAPVDIHAVVRESIALVAPDSKAQRCQVELELPPGACFVKGDAVLLQQVVVNLVVNAIDAMAETPPEGRRVTVCSEITPGSVSVSVRDAGTGLPASGDGALFEPFVTTKTSGMGIGLTIARTIVDAHRGRIDARDNPEGGATFTVTLPRSEEPVVR